MANFQGPTPPDNEKVKELIVLLSEQSEGDEYFGATKLNKLLFYTDFISYIMYGKSVTGSSYEVQPRGPMLRGFYDVRSEMERNDDIVVATRNFGGHTQHKTIAKRDPIPSKFTGEEMAIIYRVLSDFRNTNATEISELSHDFLGWRVMDVGEEIPYEIALVSTAELTPEEWAYPEDQHFDFAAHGYHEADIMTNATKNL